jgi:cytochrome P450 family 78 subfamily A
MGTTASSCTDTTWWAYALPALISTDTLCTHPALLAGAPLLATITVVLLAWAASPGRPAWAHGHGRFGVTPIPGPHGLPMFGSF